MKNSAKKYRSFPAVGLTDRAWPDKIISKAPRWCSVDLRDGNQALVTPMNIDQKLKMFKLLVGVGFKEIEVGFPSAAKVEFDFVRMLIEQDLIPEDVTIQVLTQAREHLIEETCRSLIGAKRALIHVYNSTSELQRRVVFRMSRDEVRDLAIKGTRWAKQYASKYLSAKGGSASGGKNTDVRYEYSPESFMGTETDFAVEVCDAVIREWDSKGDDPSTSLPFEGLSGPSGPVEGGAGKVIINLPNTVESATPNIFADQIEYFIRNLKERDKAIISVHCHNDRGTAVAATEFSQMAGAERVEGTLFGNGERTGNVDIVTLALNLHTQGVEPHLDLGNIDRIIETYEDCTGMTVHDRHPYAGELVFTAFSGSHQDAINKGFQAMEASKSKRWEVPYIPMDPKDVGRTYETVVRINTQSGKGGVAHILRTKFGFNVPKAMQPELGKMVQKISDVSGKEVLPAQIKEAFEKMYINIEEPIALLEFHIRDASGRKEGTAIAANIRVKGKKLAITGEGNGPIDAFSKALKKAHVNDYTFLSYEEHALGTGEDARAVAYIQIANQKGEPFFGIGIDPNIVGASLRALLSAFNRSKNFRTSPARSKNKK